MQIRWIILSENGPGARIEVEVAVLSAKIFKDGEVGQAHELA